MIYLHNGKELFEEVVYATANANEIGLHIAITEKDYYVTIILRELSKRAPECTFIDKVFAICDYYLEDDLKFHSRHIFDIYMLLSRMNFNDEFVQLIKEVREHRRQTGRCQSSASHVNIQSLLLQIVEKEYMK